MTRVVHRGAPRVPVDTKGESILRRLWLLLWTVPVVLFAAAAFELALALGLAGNYGSLPGQDIEGEPTVARVAGITMLVGSAFALVHAIRPWQPLAVALFAPAAAAVVTARFYTYDPYYLPTLQRYSEQSGVLEAWILGTLAVAIIVGVKTRRRPRGGSIATAFMLFLLLSTFVLGSTH